MVCVDDEESSILNEKLDRVQSRDGRCKPFPFFPFPRMELCTFIATAQLLLCCTFNRLWPTYLNWSHSNERVDAKVDKYVSILLTLNPFKCWIQFSALSKCWNEMNPKPREKDVCLFTIMCTDKIVPNSLASR